MRPNCECGHNYEAHHWGTTGCSLCSQEWSFCARYRQSLCPCGHVWESHGIVDGNPDELACPFCGKSCKHWRKEMSLVKICSCGHLNSEHDASPTLCRVCHCTEFSLFLEKSPENGQTDKGKIERALEVVAKLGVDTTEIKAELAIKKSEKICTCGHPESLHETDAEFQWCDGCCKNGELPVADCCKKFQELDAYAEYEDCVCGHGFWVHGLKQEEHDEECIECYENNNIPMHLVCKKYRPKSENPEDFKTVNDAALKQIGQGTVPKVTYPYSNNWESNTGYGHSQQTLFKKCEHPPTKVFADKGAEIWVGTRSCCTGFDVKPNLTQFDVILNCAKMGPVLPHHKLPISFGKKYTTKTIELEIDWPDMGAPMLAPEFWLDLYQYLKKSKGKMLAFCIGGHGRTGTALACMLVASGWKHRDAKNWIWKNYCKSAIESATQEKYIKSVEEGLTGVKKGKK
jgi:hypothetical protein